MFIFLVLNFFYVALWGLNTNFVKSGKAIQILEKSKFFLSKMFIWHLYPPPIQARLAAANLNKFLFL